MSHKFPAPAERGSGIGNPHGFLFPAFLFQYLKRVLEVLGQLAAKLHRLKGQRVREPQVMGVKKVPLYQPASLTV